MLSRPLSKRGMVKPEHRKGRPWRFCNPTASRGVYICLSGFDAWPQLGHPVHDTPALPCGVPVSNLSQTCCRAQYFSTRIGLSATTYCPALNPAPQGKMRAEGDTWLVLPDSCTVETKQTGQTGPHSKNSHPSPTRSPMRTDTGPRTSITSTLCCPCPATIQPGLSMIAMGLATTTIPPKRGQNTGQGM